LYGSIGKSSRKMLSLQRGSHNGCPFHAVGLITGLPGSYCMIGDCLYDPDTEVQCPIYVKHKEILRRIELLC